MPVIVGPARTITLQAAVGSEDPAGMLAAMALDDGTDDERPVVREPPPPDDRLWRHPSEVAVAAAVAARQPARCGDRRSVVRARAARRWSRPASSPRPAGCDRDVTVIRRADTEPPADCRSRHDPRPSTEVDAIADTLRPSIAQVVDVDDRRGQGRRLRRDVPDDGQRPHELRTSSTAAQTIKVVLADGRR